MGIGGQALIVGVGGLGGSAALTLASAGVGRLVLLDHERVGPSDLGRSALLGTDDIGAPRAGAAAARLGTLFPKVEVVAEDRRLAPAEALGRFSGAGVVLAAVEEPALQFLAGVAALRAGVPVVHAGALRTTAQLLTVRPGGAGACLFCLFEEPPTEGELPTAQRVGVLGPVSTLAGALLGAEALRLLAGEHGAYEGRLLTLELRSGSARSVAVPRRASCRACAPLVTGTGPVAAGPTTSGEGLPSTAAIGHPERPRPTDGSAAISAQLLVPGLGEGQPRLAQARVRVIGAGPSAAPALLSLAQAGVGLLWIDDPTEGSVDPPGWLHHPAAATQRGKGAAASLSTLRASAAAAPYPTGGVPTATLVCAPTVTEALAAAEQARRAGVLHVVMERDADGGSVVVVPPGAPCYACARSASTAWRPWQPAGAALACLAAAELVMGIALPSPVGVRVDLARGVPTVRTTTRLAGCSCAAAKAVAR